MSRASNQLIKLADGLMIAKPKIFAGLNDGPKA
jgi:hypothetical protein